MSDTTKKETPVQIILEGKTFNIKVPEGTPILDAGLDADIDIPFSCQSGSCGSCRGKVLKGEVEMEEEEGLTPEEIEEGYILSCVSFPKSSDLVIEIG